MSCTKDIGPNPDLIPKQSNICDSVTFTKTIKPIFDSKCISCHFAGGSGPGDFTTYAGIKLKVDAGLIKGRLIDVTGAIMPQGGPALPSNQLDLIKCWLDAGAPNN